MEINKRTFCAAPWFQIRNENLGEYRVCCDIDHAKTQFKDFVPMRWPEHSPEQWLNSDYVKYLRENLTVGQRLPECHECWRKEAANENSVRQAINDTVTRNHGNDLENTWLATYFRNKTDYHSDLLLAADIKLTNMCNFACAMCNPADSSQIYTLWKRDSDHVHVMRQIDQHPDLLAKVKTSFMDRSNHALLRDILDSGVKNIKILGGEPLLDQEMLDILVQRPAIQKSKIGLFFVTNGSVDLTNITEILHGYKSVRFGVSLEGVGAVQEWVRRGANWQQIDSNLRRAHANGIGISVHHTRQALTAWHLPDLLDWSRSAGIEVFYTMLYEPRFLSLAVIPPDLMRQTKHRCKDESSQHVLSTVEHDATLVQEMRTFLSWYDPQENWQKVFPEWIGHI